ncbi:MAG: methyltransferase domain-containing protein [Bdellovibrionales bacterium]|nr:methyltransferase domain-containing protein [Bdellovibrionales bacterium]
MSITQTCHLEILQRVKKINYAIDATCGNGHDTLFLCQNLEREGKVFALDLQPQAIANTKLQLQRHDISQDRYSCILSSHDQIQSVIPSHLHLKIEVIMFNLGYLPGSDKKITTAWDTTQKAIEYAIKNYLSPNGVMSILFYPGHLEGREELTRWNIWKNTLNPHCKIEEISNPTTSSLSPVLFVLQKTTC